MRRLGYVPRFSLKAVAVVFIVVGGVYALIGNSTTGAAFPLYAGLGLSALGLALRVLAVRPAGAVCKGAFWVPVCVWGALWTHGGVLNTGAFVDKSIGLFGMLALLASIWAGLRIIVFGRGRRNGRFSSADQPGR